MDEKTALFCKEFKENFGFDSRFMIFDAEVVKNKKSRFLEVKTTEGHFSSVIKKFYKIYFDNSPELKIKILVLPYQQLKYKYGIAVAGICPLYSSATNKTEQINQVIIGETFDVLEVSGDEEWYRIRIHTDGYMGWINKNPVKLIDEREYKKYRKSKKVEITKKFADVHSLPGKKSAILRGVFMGVELSIVSRRGEWIEVKLPDGIKGWISKKSCRDYDDTQDSRKDIMKYAEALLGIPYIWGGRSAFGIDCSAYTQLMYKMCGFRIPRDSNMQAKLGMELGKSFADFRKGDLLFFGNKEGRVTHVAIYTGKEMDFIHASGFVRINSLDENSDRYDERLSKMFFGGRRIINI